MKKIINDPLAVVDEMLEGILKAHPLALKSVGGDLRAIVRADAPINGKVGIATGGGSGHLPVFMGYVGKGLIDGASIGNVFSSPTTGQMLRVTKAIDGGEGVLYLYGRYQGDMMNFDTAAEMAEDEGIHVETLMVSDDVASAPPRDWQRRRGVAGLFFAYKIAGAKADEDTNLAEVKATTEKALSTIRSMGVALGPCTVPAVGKPTFTIGELEMEIGMGIHGEAGIHRGPLKKADEIADILVDAIVKDLPYKKGDQVAVLVNSLGGTPLEELYILYRRVALLLEEKGIANYRPYVGRYACSMEMQGASLTLMRLDDELKRLRDAVLHPEVSRARAQPREKDMKTTLAKDDLVALLMAISDEMIASKEELCELDSVIGDGDLGVTVTLGFNAVKKTLQGGGALDMQGVLSDCGVAFADNAASTFGALMSTMMIRAGCTVKEKDQIGPAEAAAMIQAAAEGVEQRGKAHVGDKTLLDALVPASQAFGKAAGEKCLLPDCIEAALEAARKGADETTNLRSKAGRSGWLGDRTIGARDPGATAIVILLEAATRFIKN